MALFWTQGALDDLDRIAMFNEQFSEARAAHVNWRIISQALARQDPPRPGGPAGGDLRDLSLSDIQYVMTYALSGADVTIIGVRSTRENRGVR